MLACGVVTLRDEVVVRCGYLRCVDDLRSELICTAPHVRPTHGASLAPFDQASQRPVFGAKVDRGTPEEFLAWAASQDHPSDAPLPPLDGDLEAAIRFVWRFGSSISAERRRRMSLLHSISASLEPLSSVLAAHMSDAAIHIARAMQLNIVRRGDPHSTLSSIGDRIHPPHYALWCAFLDALSWPQHNLVARMLYGSPPVGVVPDSGVFRPVDRPSSMPFSQFASSNISWTFRCMQRVLSSARRDPERAQACWTRTIEERDAGLVLGPFTLSQVSASRDRGFPACGWGLFRPLPRFAIWQGEKWRCIDDGAISGHNADGTTSFETIVCDRPDSPMRIGLRFHELGPPPSQPDVAVEMEGGTDDAFAAYRRVVSSMMGYTTVMVAAPPEALHSGSELCAMIFHVPGFNFGLTSAVLHFNCLAEMPLIFSRRFFATPCTRFYDDHGVHEPSYAQGSGQFCHVELHELLRFHFDLGKHRDRSQRVVYTGVCTDWSRQAEGIVSLGVTRARRLKLRALIASILADQSLTSAEAGRLRAKARFCVCPVFGRVGLAAVQLLRERQRSPSESAITSELADVLAFLDIVVDLLPSFTVRFRRERIRPTCVVLTDASFATGHKWLGFLVMCPICGALWAGLPSPEWLLELLRRHVVRQTEIGQLELAAAAAPYFSVRRSWWEDRPVLHYVDNQGALYSLIKGGSNDADSNRLTFITNMRLARLRCDAWFDYVPSASNFADLPTRLDDDAIARLSRVARRVPLRLPPEWSLACPLADLRALFV